MHNEQSSAQGHTLSKNQCPPLTYGLSEDAFLTLERVKNACDLLDELLCSYGDPDQQANFVAASAIAAMTNYMRVDLIAVYKSCALI